ncbi:hypothetical protein [Paraburkholderia bannensis]|uniref:hypothetical protein n=1 Tax=Paraburkholderia bannensis TaxID=765414 RepID=UPI0012EC3E2B|nr:hypothetical protein [Paraburkholderia bannensis]
MEVKTLQTKPVFLTREHVAEMHDRIADKGVEYCRKFRQKLAQAVPDLTSFDKAMAERGIYFHG